MPDIPLTLSLDELKEVFPIQSDLIDYMIFMCLLQKNEPTGSWTLKELFDQAGLKVGTATIGRNLKMMDSQGSLPTLGWKRPLICVHRQPGRVSAKACCPLPRALT